MITRRAFQACFGAAAAGAMTPSLAFSRKTREGALPIIFLHSLGGSPRQWRAQTRLTSSEGRLGLAHYWSGHGGLPLPAGPATMEALATNLAVRLSSVGLNRAIFVGHSAGAALALATARIRPELVPALLLADPPGDLRMLPTADTSAFLAGMNSSAYPRLIAEYWSSILKGARPTTTKIVMGDLWRTPQATVVHVLTALSTFDSIAVVERFRGPLLSVTSPLNEAPNSLHKLCPQLAHKSLQHVSHWLQMDASRPFNNILTTFIEKHCVNCR